MEYQTEIADYIKAELSSIFPNSGVYVFTRTIIGESNVHIFYTNAKSAKECENGILENDPAYMGYYIEYDEDEGKAWADRPVTHSSRLSSRDIKFRKINGKSQQEVAEKLVAWFRKNADKILSAGLRH